MARILVAEDEEGLRSFLSEALESEGHRVITVGDGADALAALSREEFDLIVSDLRMPRVDGMSLLARVRQEQPHVEFVMLTAHGTVENAVAAMKAGAFEYLMKPLSGPEELRLIVARAVEHRSLVAAKERSPRSEDPVLTWRSAKMGPIVEAIRKVAPTRATVLLLGESGTGKEVAARAIHAWSDRADRPFVAVSCAALPEALLETELFGHEKGAFTGASTQRRGRIELADGGTFFLDEIGELTLGVQAKLLRVLQERRFERVGGTRTIDVDVRWIAATNRELQAMVRRGEFREDLYHRVSVFPVELPPLRERREDILPLAEVLLREIAEDLGRPGLALSGDAASRLERLAWPGNARELRNALERAAILADDDVIEPRHLGGESPSAGTGAAVSLPTATLEELERLAIEQALAAEGGNRKRAAVRLGIGLRTLYEKLKRYGV